MYKTRLATMNFIGDAMDRYRAFKKNNPVPSPWLILVHEVKERFKEVKTTNPFGELRKVKQTGTVSEYIKEFEKAKTR